ncbi:MAG TPA: outer membrane protein assembly factor BamD [Gallionellaceae bacterium]|nr:outer membrane protein assembly factor BamD [Gallionellaceae bacterium]
MRTILSAFLLFTLISLTACSSIPKQDLRPASELYTEAQMEMEDFNYEKAVKLLETLQSRYPYGRYAQQALMEIAYANYKQNEPDAALSAADRFIKQFPNSSSLDYIYYLKGLINFNDNAGFFSKLSRQDPAERDPQTLRDSFDSFRELVTRFPDSLYAEDAKLRMQFLINTLSRSDIRVASYYLRRGAYIAAINRANNVLKEFPQTRQTRDALQIMVWAYNAMGQNDLRDDTQRILDLNIAKDGIKPSIENSRERAGSWWQFWM